MVAGTFAALQFLCQAWCSPAEAGVGIPVSGEPGPEQGGGCEWAGQERLCRGVRCGGAPWYQAQGCPKLGGHVGTEAGSLGSPSKYWRPEKNCTVPKIERENHPIEMDTFN